MYFEPFVTKQDLGVVSYAFWFGEFRFSDDKIGVF